MILEFAALSRLTGITVYEDKARKAMDYLWQQRHRSSDLMGLIINVHSGDWIRRESGVGAGIDSYYEYVLKAYILLGDDDYLARFNKHYDAVMRYVSQGPLLMDVHMHKPNAISRNFMDALLAFWPGLQVLKGDLVPAIETHEMLYQVMQRHNFIPEAFTTDFRVHWSHHPLRPEFIESTYFLYKATGDKYYLEAGKKVLENLEEHARVPCGYAAIKNVKTGAHEDQMDSYVLAEMFKYLYLLFAERSDLLFDIDDFIFTTEAHLLPLALSVGNITAAAASRLPKIRREVYNKFQVDLNHPTSDNYITTTINPNAKSDADEINGGDGEEDTSGDHVCPNLHVTHVDGLRYPHSVRSQIQNIVNRLSPHQRSRQPRLRASDFIAGNKDQLELLHHMGIRMATMADGRIQLLHTASEARSPEDAEDGMQFMQEMIELSKQQQPEAQHDPMFIHVSIPGLSTTMTLRAGPAQFGYDLKEGSPVSGMLAVARPFKACREFDNTHELTGHIVVLERGDCMFVDKARNLQRIGAKGGIVLDHNAGSSSDTQPLFAMSGDGMNDVTIPLVFLYYQEGHDLLKLLGDNSFLEVRLSADAEDEAGQATVVEEKEQEVTSDTPQPTSSVGPDSVQVVSGQTLETDPLELSQQQPVKPPTSAGTTHADEEEDRFDKLLDDKFYHHEAMLRDLYYLQSPGYEQHKPHLNQLYMDAVRLLQLHSNFNELQHATDYLRALARFLEAAYFGMSHVGSDALTLMRSLSRNLEQGGGGCEDFRQRGDCESVFII
nr:hypothetical protein BaRGS_016222 [Batillaria attramentaria]